MYFGRIYSLILVVKYQEIPYVFRRKFAQNLGNVVKLFFGGNHTFEVGYCSSTGSLKGLLELVKHFHLMENYILLFTFKGNSAFFVSVYDSQCLNHLRDVYGNSTISEFEDAVDNGIDEGT